MNKNELVFLKTVLFKALPLLLLAIAFVLMLKYFALPFLGVKINEWVFPIVLLVICAVIGSKVIGPAKVRFIEARKDIIKGKSETPDKAS